MEDKQEEPENYSVREDKLTTIHFEKPIEKLDDRELAIVDDIIYKMKEVCPGKLVTATDKKSDFKKLIIRCEEKARLGEIKTI